jgi:ribosomal protein L19E
MKSLDDQEKWASKRQPPDDKWLENIREIRWMLSDPRKRSCIDFFIWMLLFCLLFLFVVGAFEILL